MAALFGGLGLSEGVVRAIAAWKEVAIVALLAVAIARAITGGGSKMEIAIPDVLVLTLLSVAVCYLMLDRVTFSGLAADRALVLGTQAGLTGSSAGSDGPPSSLGSMLPSKAAFFGFRDMFLFILLYFVGRATPEIGSDNRFGRRLYVVGVVTSVIAVLELVLISPDTLVLIGASSYFQDFLGVSAFTAGNEYGLPQSYWSRLGNRDVRRAGSVYLSGQGFAVPFLLILPAATVWVFGREKKPGKLVLAGYALMWAGLLLTLTRMTIIACLVQLFAYLLWRRKPTWAITAGALGTAVLAAAVVLLPNLLIFIWETLTWQSGSSNTHMTDWSHGTTAFGLHPLGWGLGTTDAAAIRTGRIPLTADNQYLRYAVELGIVGLVLHLAILVSFIAIGLAVVRRSQPGSRRSLAQILVLTTLGVAMNAMTGVVFNSMMLSYLYFWLAGAVVSVWQLERGRYRIPSPRLTMQPT
jgi:hypothetical protein